MTRRPFALALLALAACGAPAEQRAAPPPAVTPLRATQALLDSMRLPQGTQAPVNATPRATVGAWRQLEASFYACASREAEAQLGRVVASGDASAAHAILAQGDCRILRRGTRLFVEGGTDNVLVVRPAGELATYRMARFLFEHADR